MGKASRKKKDSLPATRDPLPVIPEARIAGSGSRVALIALGLAILTIAVFAQVVTHDFIDYDDPDYLSANAVVMRGLTVEGVKYAFTTIQPYYWQPLTWLSLEAFGTKPGVQLAVNVVLHAAAVVLLFLLLARTTGEVGLAAFASAIWAVHPLRVESVAWVAERKDVLSTLFFIATIYAYARGRRVLTYAMFILALMSKPMVVTLPAVLWLVDIWPLQRKPTIKDKIPLAVLAVAIVAITFFGQRAAIASNVPLGIRIANALVGYVAYLGKMFVPVHLAIIYPYTFDIAGWKVAGAALLLLAVTAAVLYAKRPHITVGWFWYLITLIPVIGIVQAGAQSMADRFSYIPSIGIIVAIVWTVRIAALGIAAVVACAALSVYNLRDWRDSLTLFSHAVEVTQNNALAHVKYGDALLGKGRTAEADQQYALAVETSHGASIPLASQGAAFVAQKRYAEAVEPLRRAIAEDPNIATVHENYGAALMNTGRPADAIPEFETALRLDNGARRAEILQGRGDAKRLAGRVDDGIADLDASIELKPTAAAWNDLGTAYSMRGEGPRAAEAYTQALRLDPNLYDAHMNFAALLSRNGQNDDAAAHIREAMRLQPKSVEPRIYLALVNAASGKKPEAAAIASEAQQLDAKAANEVFTRALHLPPSDNNLNDFIAKMSTP